MNITLIFDKKLSIKELQSLHTKMKVIEAQWANIELEDKHTEITYTRMTIHIHQRDFFNEILQLANSYHIDYNIKNKCTL